jgi:hypothetical protein
MRLAKPKGSGLHWLLEVALEYEGDECLRWPFSKTGYGIVTYNGRKTRPSRVMCLMKYGAPPTTKHQAAHSCARGHEGCVNPRHLRWATPAENQNDRIAHGTSNRGKRGKLTPEDVLWIRSAAGKMRQQDIADKFCLDQSSISYILKGTRWGWLTKSEGE